MPPLPEPATGAITFDYLAEIATGETARVDLCRATSGKVGQLLAVKRLHAHVAEDPQFANMFLDEVWMTASLKHPNVVEVAGWGSDQEGTYLAVELVQGVSLARLMKTVFDTGEVFTERMVVFIAAELCAGLAAAHALEAADGEPLHLVHRDLTPGNVLIGFAGDVKIADFGLAKAKQRVTQTLTGLLKGKPQYMSPEQARGEEIDGRSDLFSVGVLLFELFAGRRPWSATSELEIMQATANTPPLDLRELRPKIDKELVAIVEGCLEKDTARRFQTAEDVRVRFEDWLRAHGYLDGSADALARFVRRNAMRQMRWFERAIGGELAPIGDDPRSVRPKAPRVPTFTSGSNAPVPPRASGSDGRRARVKPRTKSVDIDPEATDITEIEPRLAAGGGAPRKVAAGRRAEGPGGEIDWGEEVPTLVQRAGTPIAVEIARARVKARAAAPRPQFDAKTIHDEESDARTTSIKRLDLRGVPPSPAARGLARPTLPRISDMDSEEAATNPLQGIPADPITAETSPIRLAPLRRSTNDGAVPGQVVAPHPSAPPPPFAPRFNAPPLPSEGQRPSGPFASASPPSGVPAVSEGAPRESLPPGPLTEDALAAEADRFAGEARRLDDEARAAAATAQRLHAVAKLAADSARLAAEAVRSAPSVGLAQAAARLELARAIEAAVARGDFAQAQASVPEPLPTPSAASFPPPPPRPVSMLPEAPRASMPPPMMHHPHAAPTTPFPAAREPLSASRFDDDAFRRQLQPTVLGVPVGVAAFLGGGALFVLVLVLWLVAR